MKTLKELTLLDRFLFNQVTENPEMCRIIAEIALSRPVAAMQSITKENTIECFYGLRGIRLDILAYDEEEVIFDLEMQKEYKQNLPKRSRYYQAQIDISTLQSGEPDFNKLNDTYIIFICPFDLFGAGKYRYTFTPRSQEDPQISLNDGATRIFLNTKGTNDDEVPTELIEFLHYIDKEYSENNYIGNQKIQAIDQYIHKIKQSHEMGVKYMDRFYEERLMKQEAHDAGFADGLSQGELLKLINIIRKKILKGKDITATADDLEETVEAIQLIYGTLSSHMDDTDEAILNMILNS